MADETIEDPKPQITDYRRVQIATSQAFDCLIEHAANQGLKLNPVGGIHYLPSATLANSFEKICTAILESLKAG